MNTIADRISEFAYDKYVRPALERGDKMVTIESGEVYVSLGRSYSLDVICAILGSMKFRNTYHIALERSTLFGTSHTFRLNFETWHREQDGLCTTNSQWSEGSDGIFFRKSIGSGP